MATDRHSTFWKLYKAFVVSFIYWVALEIVVAIIHEGGHAVAALFMGVPLGEIQISLRGLVPTTSIPLRFATSNLITLYHYAGGFTSGLILIIFYFLYWYKRYQEKPTPMNWGMGAATAATAGVEIFESYMEGRFYAVYMQGSGILFSVLYLLPIIGAILIHRILFPYSKIKEKVVGVNVI